MADDNDALLAENRILRLKVRRYELLPMPCVCGGSWGIDKSEMWTCGRCERLREIESELSALEAAK